jgi:hypothetical protein
VIALVVLAYVIYRNVYPAPAFPFNIFPYIAAWLVVGLGTVLLVPGLARRIGTSLAEREELTVEENSEVSEKLSEKGPMGSASLL